MDILPKKFRTPEIYGDYWFNSDPIPLGALRGYTILINFWDYTSASSLRSLPYLQEWHRRYSEIGLVIIGVHSPEFPFARDPVRVRKAVEKLGIRYPVVMDDDFLIWEAFRNRVWPTNYLIDREGFIRYTQQGEGSYQNFEHAVQSLLSEAGYRADFPIVMEPLRDIDRSGIHCYRPTPEILVGYQRGTVGNVGAYAPESTSHYEDPGYYLEGRLYLEGDWLNTRDYLKLEESEGREGYLVLGYQAKEVNTVVKPEGETNFQVFVQQDDHYLVPENRGDDILFDNDVRSYFLVTEPRLYNIVRNKEFGEHRLKLSARSNGFALYSVSFLTSAISEVLSNN